MTNAKILRIPAAFVSRVSNAKVLQRAGAVPFSKQLLHRQLVLLGKVARAPTGSVLRGSTFVDDTLLPQVGRYVRRVGRPHFDWHSYVRGNFDKPFGYAVVNQRLRDKSEDSERRWANMLQQAFQP